MQTETTVEPEVATEDGKVVFAKGADIEIRATGNPPKTYPTEFRAAPKYRYGQILPHEVWAFSECVKDCNRLFRSSFSDQECVNMIGDIQRQLSVNPYSFFCGCTDAEAKPLGYVWFEVGRNSFNGKSYVTGRQEYIVPELRDTLAGARINQRFLSCILDVMDRCNCEYWEIQVPNKNRFDTMKKLGFEALSTNMVFKGNAKDFIERNPVFQNKKGEVK